MRSDIFDTAVVLYTEGGSEPPTPPHVVGMFAANSKAITVIRVLFSMSYRIKKKMLMSDNYFRNNSNNINQCTII